MDNTKDPIEFTIPSTPTDVVMELSVFPKVVIQYQGKKRMVIWNPDNPDAPGNCINGIPISMASDDGKLTIGSKQSK